MPAALCFTLVSAMSAVAAVLSAALCAPWRRRAEQAAAEQAAPEQGLQSGAEIGGLEEAEAEEAEAEAFEADLEGAHFEEADLEGGIGRLEEEEAEEAAEEVPIVTEADGMRLHLSPNSATGYLGVYLERGKFCAQTKVGGRGAPRIFLGSFGTAVEAAVAYARRVGEAAAPEERQETELRRWFPAIYEIDGKWRLCFVGKTSSSSDWWRTSGCVERLGDSARASTRFRTVNGTVYLLVGKCEAARWRRAGEHTGGRRRGRRGARALGSC
ncbi:hypothetical protein EMIHUDRAFT_119013 [Emiliania huxleyi CCMP1516]|uniref:AP2/ERF domain-containing protein n=2 Tax=Emiliania huxleyi TaxID=2903 RepID=A0A0D3IZ25_EMIH1|nr:hypothetical protein EMIHUDRAFT_119013 [Emiliania huxleyi CCMP1516]EOD16510.1 hypothetical protein EMIHUDRAFT_119013 [Emiliania huxleyi CCMP1516]|eukprot:XP_005768939.1 hypothetical protein EMIHUDRAFT_119013 [Emiliania huxleyi CCMP1516]